VVNTVHGLYATRDDPPIRKVPVLASEWLAALFSDLELYQSEEDLLWSRRRGVVRVGKSELLGNGTDLGHFDPTSVDERRRSQLRGELGIGDGVAVVGTVGRLVKEKGYVELATASRIVRRTIPGVCFLAIGPGDLTERDAILVDDVGDSLVFTGMRADVRDLLSLMDVFVLATWREGLPRSAIEAAAMGKAMVLTDVRGCREVVRDGIEGILVPRRDPDALAEAILRLLRDDDLRMRVGSAARERALQRFDERAVEQIIVSSYRALLRGGGEGADRVMDRSDTTIEGRERPG
jgi:glycosyltransferase involved in cell wall biosynthesis